MACRATVERLRRSWYAAPEDKDPPGTPVAATAGANGICAHAACGKLAYCVVAKLEEVKAAYTPGERAATFKIKVDLPPGCPRSGWFLCRAALRYAPSSINFNAACRHLTSPTRRL